ncbi:hypothetical protein M438DRAFT_56550 [Aureobasidium pullulans EXF-150]|uniref:Uncharacterized protein n=1 Tax=Aureobasidium pullulans EXF-150 TaxID=1043002 RepID=A0A074Y5I7_AURPU|nr:uncharacterized protein M438DRAFT_56550 [Aureobasidium pullulans EXF-150]KEQ82141.1 hypothetical protein M438DRAFT_56550 [Aureobasidium pullulans EXF-150]
MRISSYFFVSQASHCASMSRSRIVSRAIIALCPSTRASKLSNIPLPFHLSRSDINSILAGDQQSRYFDMQRLSLRLSRMEAGQARIPIYTRQLLQWEFTNVSQKLSPSYSSKREFNSRTPWHGS